jgi:hypothetical protein
VNNKIRNKIRQRNIIHYKAKTTNNPDHWKKFREIRNEAIALVNVGSIIISYLPLKGVLFTGFK